MKNNSYNRWPTISGSNSGYANTGYGTSGWSSAWSDPVYVRGGFTQQQHAGNSQYGQTSLNQVAQRKKNVLKRHTPFPFVRMPDSMEHMTVALTPKNITCFHGFSNVFSLQHKGEFTVDGKTYKSVDQYYQMRKVQDLLGIESEKFTDGSTKDYSGLAKNLLREGSVDRNKIDKWRVTSGVEVVQKALLEKVKQCEELRKALVETGDKLIVQSYVGDDFFGAGAAAKEIKDWASKMEKNKVSVKVPTDYPLTSETLKHVPVIGKKGRNVLGIIYMILREKMNKGLLTSLQVTLSEFGNVDLGAEKPKPGNRVNKKTDPNSMEIDFTKDYDADSTSLNTSALSGGSTKVPATPANTPAAAATTKTSVFTLASQLNATTQSLTNSLFKTSI
ncbi:hypothetical protein DdX_09561 [Ditylenchus destructor]|uniref:NADAR domain-containing protein n=1 Tax=Ditylenchus destructor TaxID=166010 RepID=A0AAD4N283_9BILA|nr:hypothetical protein DdX_09561 [Ditylenchus destructor]